jgi:hypothetical protein
VPDTRAEEQGIGTVATRLEGTGYTQGYNATELEFLKSLWGLGTEEE